MILRRKKYFFLYKKNEFQCVVKNFLIGEKNREKRLGEKIIVKAGNRKY